ncbi:hypothetical protein GW17_00015161 [Ensete ventricosum]|nr:hypothetical protein GW17_00015161 [Ensete ventricosum]
MPKTATSEFPLSLAFGTEVVLLAEVVFSTLRVENYEEGILEEGLRANLDLVKERRVEAHLRALAYKNAVARLYNRKVHPRLIKVGDLVMWRAEVSDPTQSRVKLAPNWRDLTGSLHMILPLDNQDLSLLDICHVGVTFLFAFFPLEVSETTVRLDYSVLLNNLCMVLPPQIRLRDCDSSPIHPPLHPSRPCNVLNLLHTSVSCGYILSMPKRKFQCSMTPSFGRLGMVTNTPSSAYKPLHEYQVLRVSNSLNFCELCITLSVVAQHIPLCTVSSFTKRPACLEHRQV